MGHAKETVAHTSRPHLHIYAPELSRRPRSASLHARLDRWTCRSTHRDEEKDERRSVMFPREGVIAHAFLHISRKPSRIPPDGPDAKAP